MIPTIAASMCDDARRRVENGEPPDVALARSGLPCLFNGHVWVEEWGCCAACRAPLPDHLRHPPILRGG